MSATELMKTVNYVTAMTSQKKPRSWVVLLLAAFTFLLSGCAMMENAKIAATEMTTSAPEVGPYDPPAATEHPFIPAPLARKPPPPPSAAAVVQQPQPPA